MGMRMWLRPASGLALTLVLVLLSSGSSLAANRRNLGIFPPNPDVVVKSTIGLRDSGPAPLPNTGDDDTPSRETRPPRGTGSGSMSGKTSGETYVWNLRDWMASWRLAVMKMFRAW
jgi:hypothetical protein